MEFRILGPLEVEVDDEIVDLGPKKQRSLFALLLINHNRVVSTDRILDELWGDEAEGKENALWVYVSRLRSALGDASQEPVLVTRGHGYTLAIDPETLDAYEFEKLAKSGASLLKADAQAAATELSTALDVWRGRALEEFEYDDFARSEIARLEDLRSSCLDNRIEADLKRGLSGELIGELERIVEERPLDELPVSQLMLAQYRAGRQADALRCFERFRRGIGEELGIDPSPELRRLEEQVLLHDSRLQLRSSAHTSGVASATLRGKNPFRGLAAFREEDSNLFFGRDGLVSDITRRLSDFPIVSIVGSSGCGKSSAVRSGVLPAIRKGAIAGSDTWLIAQMVPGSNPFAELEAALLRTSLDAPSSLTDQLDGAPDEILRAVFRVSPREDSRVVIVIDQFEELFTLCDPETAARFLTALAEAASDPHGRVRVMITLRADFYDRPLGHPSFGTAMSEGIVNVAPMAPEELEQAASQPAARAGVRLEPGLEAALIGDVLGEPGALPLFQFALTDLFDRRVGDTLTLSAYRDMGGIQGTISRKAEQLFDTLTPTQQAAARQIFLRLVAISDTETRSRRRVEASELLELGLDVGDLQAVLQSFGRERLLSYDRNDTSGAPTVEVAHEALLEHWERLAGWIEEGKEDVRRNVRLTATAAEWKDHGQDDGYLLAGGRLDDYENWATTSTMTLARTEREFLDTSIAMRDDLLAADAERIARETTSTRSARRNALGLVAVIAVAVVVGSYFIWAALQPEGPTVAWVHPPSESSIDASILDGFERAERQLGIVFVDTPLHSEDLVRQLAEDGTELIILAADTVFGFVSELAEEFPDTEFHAFDPSGFSSEFSNVSLSTFSDADGSYLMGVAAASASKTRRIGFIGGVQQDLFNRWVSAYEAGAEATDPEVDLYVSWIAGRFTSDTTSNPFDDIEGAFKAATYLYELGVDVIFTAAGDSVKGVVEAAAQFSQQSGRHVWVIGADNDEFLADATLQDYVLTSMIKRFDVGAYTIVESFLDGSLERETVFGISDGAIGYSSISGHIQDERLLEEAVAALEEGTVGYRATSAIASTWTDEPAHRFVTTFDGDSCKLMGSHEVAAGDIVSVTLVNDSGSDASLGLMMWPTGTTVEVLNSTTRSLGDPFAVRDRLGGSFLTFWIVPNGASYELRTHFDGPPMGVGSVQCWSADDWDETSYAGVFTVLGN